MCAGSVTLYLLINGQKRNKDSEIPWLHKKRIAKCPASCCENSGFWYVSLDPTSVNDYIHKVNVWVAYTSC